jgi:hypothetical protein
MRTPNLDNVTDKEDADPIPRRRWAVDDTAKFTTAGGRVTSIVAESVPSRLNRGFEITPDRTTMR